MSFLINMLEFFINNIFKISVIIIATVIFLYLIRKAYREQRLNSFLRLRQRTLRRFHNTSRKMRIISLTVLITLPLAFTAWFLVITRLPGLDFDNHISHIDNVEHLVEIHQRYHPNYTAIRFGTAPDDNGDYDSITINTTHLFRHISTDNSMHTMLIEDNILYTLYEKSLVITDLSDFDAITEHRTIEFDDEFFGLGFYVFEDTLILLGKSSDNYLCLPYRLSCHNSEEDDLIQVVFYNLDSGQRERIMTIRGNLADVRLVDQALVMVINQSLPYTEEGQLDSARLSNFLPTVNFDGEITTKTFRDIKYIEGTMPNTFTSVIHINMENLEYNHETLLTDINYNLAINEDSVYIFNNSYVLKEITDHFITPDPIDYTNTAVTMFTFDNNSMVYEKSKIFSGEIFSYESLELKDDIRFVTVNKEEIKSFYRISKELDILQTSVLPIQDDIEAIRISEGNIYLRMSNMTPTYRFIRVHTETNQLTLQNISSRDNVMNYYINRRNQLIGFSLNSGLFSMSIYQGESIEPGEDLYWYIRNLVTNHEDTDIQFDISNIDYNDENDKVIIPIYSLNYDMIVMADITLTQGFRNVTLITVDNTHDYFRLHAVFNNDHFIIRDESTLKIYYKDDMTIPVYVENN